MNRRTLFKLLAAIPFVRSIPYVKRRIYHAAKVRITIGGVPFEPFNELELEIPHDKTIEPA